MGGAGEPDRQAGAPAHARRRAAPHEVAQPDANPNARTRAATRPAAFADVVVVVPFALAAARRARRTQFGHLFAHGPTREAALRSLVVALRDVVVRGEVRTIVDYALGMLQVRRADNPNLNPNAARRLGGQPLGHTAAGRRATCSPALA